jgi:phage tail-like protein
VTEKFEFQLQVTGPGTAETFSVPLGKITIGRQAGNDLQLDQPQVSRQHATIECTATECHITDLASSNGTRVDGEQLTPHVAAPLAHLALINIGPFDLIFKQIPAAVGEPAEMPPPPPPAAEIKPPPEPEPAAEPVPEAVRIAAGPPPPLVPPPPPPAMGPGGESLVPPGLSLRSRRLLEYLPGIYHTDFMARFLGIFESILTPIEWNVDNFDLYLTPDSSPASFLTWLANWFAITFDPSWSETQRRTFLAEAHEIYARRGTRWALSRVLEIYTGQTPEIEDQGKDQEPFTFAVRLPLRAEESNREALERIIDANKPAQTTYSLEFRP